MAKVTTLDDIVESLRGRYFEIEDRAEKAEHERDSLRVELDSKPVALPEGSTPLTEESLRSHRLMLWREKQYAFQCEIGRLKFLVRPCGTWWLSFDSTYGGQIGSYRKLKSIEEMETLMFLLGMESNPRKEHEEQKAAKASR